MTVTLCVHFLTCIAWCA